MERTNFTSSSQLLKGVHRFTASHCNISNVSGLFKQFGPTLEYFDLSLNPLGKLENVSFGNVTYLKLNLSRTNLWHINFSSNCIWILDLSHNHLKSVNLTVVKNWLLEVHLNENELTDVDQFTRAQFLGLNRISVSDNLIPCKRLTQFINEWPEYMLIDNPLIQKHGDCTHSNRLLGNLGFVGDFLNDFS